MCVCVGNDSAHNSSRAKQEPHTTLPDGFRAGPLSGNEKERSPLHPEHTESHLWRSDVALIGSCVVEGQGGPARPSSGSINRCCASSGTEGGRGQ